MNNKEIFLIIQNRLLKEGIKWEKAYELAELISVDIIAVDLYKMEESKNVLLN